MSEEMKEKTVYCPVKNDQVDGGLCLAIVDVVDGLINPSFLYDGAPDYSVLPTSVEWTEELRQKCLNCKYHYDVKD